MRFDSMRRRIASLESTSPIADGVLSFPDGSTRAIRIGDPLAVLCHAMALGSWAGPGICEGSEQIPKQTEWQKGPRPVSTSDSTIALLARASSIETKDRFLKLVQSTCQQAVEWERKKTDCTSHAPDPASASSSEAKE